MNECCNPPLDPFFMIASFMLLAVFAIGHSVNRFKKWRFNRPLRKAIREIEERRAANGEEPLDLSQR